jgi:LacI family transcriptional regulator
VLADIAKKAGVHVTTVSLALRNSPRLPEATRTRIRALAESMGYAPDPLLQALAAYRGNTMERKSPPTLAYVTNWNSRWGWRKVIAHPDFYEGALARSKELGYQLEHFWLREPGLTHGRMSQILTARGIHGVIIASHVREIDSALQFDWSHLSAVKIYYFPHEPQLPRVTNDQLQIIRLAMQKVLSYGYRRIGMVMDEGWDITVDRLWSAGYLYEQQAAPVEDRLSPYLFPCAESLESWLQRQRPEVVIGQSSVIMPALQNLGWRVPRDIALVDIFLDDLSGKTAGVVQNHNEVGRLAVELLAGQLVQNKFGIPSIPTTTYVEGTWHDGQSLPVPRLDQPAKEPSRSA